MIFLVIAGGILAALIIFVAIGTFLTCWYSTPYEDWVQYQRAKRRRKRRK